MSKTGRERAKEQKLKRKVERLRKELKRYEGALLEPDLDEELEKDFQEKDIKEMNEKTIKCPKCKSSMEILDLGRATYKVCTNRAKCWHREKT